MTKNSLKFSKFEGTKNSFIIFDGTKKSDAELFDSYFKKDRSKAAHELCNNKHKVSADGFVFIENKTGSTVKWDFYNSDGSEAEMCGNASRCMGAYYFEKENLKKIILQTVVGEIEVEAFSHEDVQVHMPKAITILNNLPLTLVNTGVPHAVIKVNTWSEKSKFLEEVKKFRWIKEAGANGANVTFYLVESAQQIKAITFERGVENFTQACGTGAVAAAYVYMQNDLANTSSASLKPIRVNMPGGLLSVSNVKLTPVLRGEVKHLLDFEIHA